MSNSDLHTLKHLNDCCFLDSVLVKQIYNLFDFLFERQKKVKKTQEIERGSM